MLVYNFGFNIAQVIANCTEKGRSDLYSVHCVNINPGYLTEYPGFTVTTCPLSTGI